MKRKVKGNKRKMKKEMLTICKIANAHNEQEFYCFYKNGIKCNFYDTDECEIKPYCCNSPSFKYYVDLIKLETGIIDEDVIGCFLSNYKDRNICGRFNNNGCKDLVSCQLFYKVLKENGYA
jgi:hypothetical protein